MENTFLAELRTRRYTEEEHIRALFLMRIRNISPDTKFGKAYWDGVTLHILRTGGSDKPYLSASFIHPITKKEVVLSL